MRSTAGAATAADGPTGGGVRLLEARGVAVVDGDGGAVEVLAGGVEGVVELADAGRLVGDPLEGELPALGEVGRLLVRQGLDRGEVFLESLPAAGHVLASELVAGEGNEQGADGLVPLLL